MNQIDLNAVKRSAEHITQEAGKIILSFYRGAFEVGEKSPDNPVTDADLAADAYLKKELMALLPEAAWLSEETADNPARIDYSYVWIVDPLDGTKEFVMGIPEFSISVALVHNGLPVVGIIYHPVDNRTYSAVKGGGLTVNGEKVGVTHRTELDGATIDASRSERKRGEFEPFESRMEIVTMGSIAYKLARTAAGEADATWSRGPKHEWDICAGVLLVEEGGGCCVDLDDQTFQFNQKSRPKVNGIIADNGHLHAEIIAALLPHRVTARRD